MSETHEKASIGAMYRANGMGERHPDGSYIKICVMTGHDDSERQWFLISIGGGENLAAEIDAILEKDR